ncbi:MAG: DUF2213 domain-containing protein [Proteobacteria bacterium]|nr:DUF2213 domain-containing protein [Pseudomonadota bacterium]
MLAYDKHSLNSVRHYDENGFLHVDVCNITKEQVAPYYGREIPGSQELGLIPDKIYYGYRPFEEIEKAADTFNNLPLLSEHVEDGADKKNQHLRVGSLGTNAAAQEPYLTNSLAVYDEKAIKDIESGEKKELSSAYRYDPVFKPGFFDGQRYDFRMENIRGNHVALVKEGRAGSDVVVADSNSINKGEKMSTKLKNFISKLSSKKAMAMDEDLEEALKEAIREEVKEIVPEVKVEEEVTEDAESVDKRKLIDEIGGILKGKIDEELWRTVIGKAEKLAYSDSTASADDEKPEDCAEDADFAEGVKYGEEMEKKERKKLDREHESEGAKAAMDANSIRLSIMNEFKQKNEAAQNVRALIGSVDPMAFDSAEDIYGKALELNGYNIKDYAKSSYRGMVEVLKKNKSEKSGMSFDSASTKGVVDQFPELGKVKLGVY